MRPPPRTITTVCRPRDRRMLPSLDHWSTESRPSADPTSCPSTSTSTGRENVPCTHTTYGPLDETWTSWVRRPGPTGVTAPYRFGSDTQLDGREGALRARNPVEGGTTAATSSDPRGAVLTSAATELQSGV